MLTLAFCVAVTPSIPALGASPKNDPSAESESAETPKSECELNSARGDIKHVIFIEFASLHFVRDNPNVPSDLEQMPHLLSFLENNGTLLTNHHTALPLSGTSQSGIVLTGSYLGFNAPEERKNAGTPWSTFTYAGCDVGVVGIHGMALDNLHEDVRTTFGENSLEAAMAAEPARAAQTAAELEGLAIHCAAGDPLCGDGRPEPSNEAASGGEKFRVLLGSRNIAPVLGGRSPIGDLAGKAITDSEGHIGFPGFAAMSAAQSLAYAAAMQEHGVPVTYAFISNPHANAAGDATFGPGEAAYVARLKEDDEAFDKFFARLASDGINQNNTLFVVTAEHGEHFVGGAPVPATCDGVSVACTYPKAGTIAVNLGELLGRRDAKLPGGFEFTPGNSLDFRIQEDSASPSEFLRKIAKALANVTAINPITGDSDRIAASLADSVELKLLHGGGQQSTRGEQLLLFGQPDYSFTNVGKPAVALNRTALWNGEGLSPDVSTTFLGVVAPGVRVKGIQSDVWSDHPDVRPTVLALLGLTGRGATDGRVLTELFDSWAIPKGVQENPESFLELARAYKRINAPLAELGRTTLHISTTALIADDPKYQNLERQLAAISALRDDLASAMAKALYSAEFQGRHIPEVEARQFVRSANDLLEYTKLVAANEW